MDLLQPEFRAYLERMEPGAIAGQRRNTGMCPLANYLVVCGERKPDIRETDFMVGGMDNFMDLPDWAKCFVSDVDNYSAHYITFARALNILNSIDGSAS